MEYVITGAVRRYSPNEKLGRKIDIFCHDEDGNKINPEGKADMIACVQKLISEDGQMWYKGERLRVEFGDGVFVTAICV